jgi:ABC-type phosphate/phosphonate transport system substrate-binding protein
MVRTTMAGHLFPVDLMESAGVLGRVKFVFVGTHDDVIREVLEGRCEAGAVKESRLEEYEAGHAGVRLGRLAVSAEAPETALVCRWGWAAGVVESVGRTLLELDREEEGKRILSALGIAGFVPCTSEDYGSVREMIRRLGPVWNRSGSAAVVGSVTR